MPKKWIFNPNPNPFGGSQKPMPMPGQYGQSNTMESTASACQQRCENTSGCNYFNYFEGGICAITNGNLGMLSRTQILVNSHGTQNPTIVSGDKICRMPLCVTSGQWYDPVNMPGHGSTVESTALGCQQRCERTPGCKYFNYFQGGLCAITHGDGGLHTQSPKTLVIGDTNCRLPVDNVVVSNHIICLYLLLSCFVSIQFCWFPSFQEQL